MRVLLYMEIFAPTAGEAFCVVIHLFNSPQISDIFEEDG